MPTSRIAWLATAVLLVSPLGSAAADGSASATFAVRVQLIPTMQQSMLAADIRVGQADGTLLTLTAQQRARYVEDPIGVLKAVRPDGDSHVVVKVEF